MNTADPSVPVFSGQNYDWPIHFRLLRELAKLICTTLTPYGLIPRMFPPNHPFLQQLPGLVVPVIWPGAPGNAPVFDPNFTVAEVGRFNAELSLHKMEREDYTLLLEGDAKLKRIILNSLPPVTIASISDPIHGATLLSIADIIERCEVLYGTLNVQDLKRTKLQTKIPFTSTMDMRSYTATHILAHTTAAANGQPYPEQDKVNDFLAGITACGLFRDNIAIWIGTHGAVNQQTFAGLSAEANVWFGNLDKTTVSQLNFSAAVNTVPPLPQPTTLNAQDIASIAAAVHALSLQQAPQRPRAQPAPALAPVGPHYCWSHGPGNHPGTACRHPKRGHKAQATLFNQMGGKA